MSEAGEEVSGSASGDNDDASHEDHEEEDEEDDEQEGKVESEGEAEGMADAEDEGDGFSMASLDRSLVLCKPLAIHATSFDIGPPSKNSVIFYGNDMFYILFRLYQVILQLMHIHFRILASLAQLCFTVECVMLMSNI